jgi:hypothetical protein
LLRFGSKRGRRFFWYLHIPLPSDFAVAIKN